MASKQFGKLLENTSLISLANFIFSFFLMILLLPFIDKMRITHYGMSNSALIVFSSELAFSLAIVLLLMSLSCIIEYAGLKFIYRESSEESRENILKVAVTTIFIAAIGIYSTVNSYYIIDNTEVKYHTFMEDKIEDFKNISDIRVDFGFAGRSGSTISLSYVLEFEDGTTVNLMDAYPKATSNWGQPKIDTGVINYIYQLNKEINTTHNYSINDEALKIMSNVYEHSIMKELNEIAEQ